MDKEMDRKRWHKSANFEESRRKGISNRIHPVFRISDDMELFREGNGTLDIPELLLQEKVLKSDGAFYANMTFDYDAIGQKWIKDNEQIKQSDCVRIKAKKPKPDPKKLEIPELSKNLDVGYTSAFCHMELYGTLGKPKPLVAQTCDYLNLRKDSAVSTELENSAAQVSNGRVALFVYNVGDKINHLGIFTTVISIYDALHRS
ncbi:hypothetical protein SARC_06664 [Sphaeroforma arctica JP610]|uniref:Uncharacterized protein n=1 Tax=Sphaeroforma arctica JP610 TaxID=667725 RepID=A0A0L0FVW7_9EUKA|nr:hypothetical protein SARC_06664 [Sphaeroforma arctica JP610]KNC80990.1 hypothetical protein SARC_06664 [Sphaeroforma arctica JP610]|eukprot:XP_014154892.1 hypothetical protein SARC_06664 [Sphaeroforma arctica JP610]